MTAYDPPRNLSGHFSCGPGLRVDASCCGKTFITRTNSYELEIHFPSLSDTGKQALVPPAQVAPRVRADVFDEREDGLAWGFAADWEEVSGIGQRITTVHIFRLGFTALGAVSDTENLLSMRHSVPAELDSWWELFSSWVAVLTHQDPREYFRLPGMTRREPIWTFVNGDGRRIHSAITEDAVRRLYDIEPLDEDTVRACIELTRIGEFPPAEWTFIRDARSAVLAKDYRRAVIDAGTAAELAITELLDQRLAGADPTLSEALLKRARALEGRSTLMKELKAGIEPAGFTAQLKNPRNNAAHKGQAPTRETAQQAIEVAVQLVEQSTPLLGLVPDLPPE